MARIVHFGTHEALPLAYRALLHWLNLHGYQSAGPIYERYLDDPQHVLSGQLRTEVLARIGDCGVTRQVNRAIRMVGCADVAAGQHSHFEPAVPAAPSPKAWWEGLH